MSDSERLKEVIKQYSRSTNAFASFIEIKSSQILYDVLKGRNGISKELADIITAKCLNINKYWLLTGEGEKEKTNEKNESQILQYKMKIESLEKDSSQRTK